MSSRAARDHPPDLLKTPQEGLRGCRQRPVSRVRERCQSVNRGLIVHHSGVSGGIRSYSGGQFPTCCPVR